ncbi:unnamed protein product [Schistosoma margrebowiei]|uniref:Uncharacterized protein n=1 Tax=Schistosoma margrebowiei TaxID=48269 RepID=A0A183MNG0_9TREM|nr:unnamed protein product [Schistosoma margrebowiei]
MAAGNQQLVHTPFVPTEYWSPCAPLVDATCQPTWLKHQTFAFGSLNLLKNTLVREGRMNNGKALCWKQLALLDDVYLYWHHT